MEIIKANARYSEGTFGAGLSRFALQPDWKALRCLAYYCWERSNLLNDFEASRYANALLALSAHWRDWVRPLDEWQLPQTESAAQLGSLVRHLLAYYDVPSFLDAAWLDGLTAEAMTQQNWFKLIGTGRSIRLAEDLPMPLTKRMAHHFLQAPPDLTITAALRYAQVLGLGGDERLARSLLGTRIGTSFQANEFWETVIRWLIEHPDLEQVHHGPVIDYLHDQRFVPSRSLGLLRGQPRLIPPQPNLCMRGRSPNSLLRAVERWHRQLRSRRGDLTSWKPSGFPPLIVTEIEPGGRRNYTITELISSTELHEEGTVMGHCVATYQALCQSGQTSIWSLTVEDAPGRIKRLLTLEVSNWRREIVQARGKFNRPPQSHEIYVLSVWVNKGGPGLSQWITASEFWR